MSADTQHSSAMVGSELLTQMEYARRRGCSKQYINQLVKQGRIPLVNGRIDPRTADAALGTLANPARTPQLPKEDAAGTMSPPAGSTGEVDSGMQGTFAKARTVREHFRAMREKMQFEAAAGRLVSRAEVEVAAHEIGVTFREHMTQAIDAISYRIADQFGVNRYEVRSVVTDEMTQALRRLAVNIRGNEWGFETGMVQAAGATDQTNGADNDQLTDTN